jgi:hypothetical protein
MVPVNGQARSTWTSPAHRTAVSRARVVAAWCGTPGYVRCTIDHARIPLVQLAWPLFVENILRTSLMSVDTLMLSRYSSEAVAAMSLASQLAFFIQLLYMMVSIGSSVLITQNLGAGRKRQAGLYGVGSLTLILALSLPVRPVRFPGAGRDGRRRVHGRQPGGRLRPLGLDDPAAARPRVLHRPSRRRNLFPSTPTGLAACSGCLPPERVHLPRTRCSVIRGWCGHPCRTRMSTS